VLSPIGNRSVQATKALTFTVTASDKDGEPLTYSASPLPSGARFTPSTRTFEWTPTAEQVGSHKITFKVSDGYRADTEAITIAVKPASAEQASEITLDVTVGPHRIWASGTVEPAAPGHLVTVKLFRRDGGAYKRVGAETVGLENDSTYRAKIRRPQPGRCLVQARFHGDNGNAPATAERQIRC
jgi:hypothetical protein